MNDDEVYSAVRASLKATQHALGDVTLDRPVESVTGRARARRTKQGMAGAATVGVAVAAVLGVSGSFGGPSNTPRAASHDVHITMAAFSVDTEPGGVVRVTLRELRDERQLADALAKAGVPAVVHEGEECFSHAEAPVPLEEKVLPPRKGAINSPSLLDIVPSAVPAGYEVNLAYYFSPLNKYDATGRLVGPDPKAGTGVALIAELVRKGAPLTCKAALPPEKQLPIPPSAHRG